MKQTEAERLLRMALRDLADEVDVGGWSPVGPTGEPTGRVAAAAIRRGRWLRRRRRAAVALVAVAAVAAVAVPYQLLGRSGDALVPPVGPLPATPTPASPGPAEVPTAAEVPVVELNAANWADAPVELADGWVVTGAISQSWSAPATGPDPSIVLDRSAGRYREIPLPAAAYPAPTGAMLAISDDDRPFEIGLLEAGTDAQVRWVHTGQHILTPQWSPDGRRLLLTVADKESAETRLTIVDADSGTVASWPVDTDRAFYCTDYCEFTWSPDGREVALSQTDPVGQRSESIRHPRRGIQFFSARDGSATRFVPVRGDVAGPWSWSPDGSQVVVQGQQSAQLVDVATGEVRSELPTSRVYWTSGDRLLYMDSAAGMVVAIGPDSTPHTRYRLPDRLAGRELFLAPG